MRILLVEVDPQVVDHLAEGLRQSGHMVDTADDSKNGLIKATTGSFDVIVVDRTLPEGDGLTFIRALRNIDDRTPALILSAPEDIDDRVEGLRSAGDDYLVKPFELSQLLARLEALARRTGGVPP